MHYFIAIIGIVCVIMGFYFAELSKNARTNAVGSVMMLAGLFATFAGLLNIFVPNFFQN